MAELNGFDIFLGFFFFIIKNVEFSKVWPFEENCRLFSSNACVKAYGDKALSKQHVEISSDDLKLVSLMWKTRNQPKTTL